VDATGKLSGRGAYTCPNPACLEAACKGNLLNKALEVDLSAAEKETLRAELARIIS